MKYGVGSRKRGISYVTIKGRKANWIGQILRRNCLLKHVMEGKNIGKERSDGKTR